MSKDGLAERGRGLEDAFFAKQDALLRQRLAELDEAKSETAGLSEASGITDETVLRRLIGLGLSNTTLVALTLVPLVAVAWADGSIDETERKVLLASAEQTGLVQGHPAHALFERWLATKPHPELLGAWKGYVAALPAETRATLKSEILERARTVAEAAGGFLRIGNKVSGAEQAVLTDVEEALSPSGDRPPSD